ncbi:hypothetical protein D3C76_1590260 [compost metagenome]
MVTKDHRHVRTEVSNQPGTLVGVQGDAFVVVVAQAPVELQRMLADWQQSIFLG